MAKRDTENSETSVRRIEGTSELPIAGGNADEVGIPSSLLGIGERGWEPVLPSLPAEAMAPEIKVFKGYDIQPQPPSFRGSVRDMRLVASDDPKVGDVLMIKGEGGNRMYRMGSYAYRHFCWLNNLKSAEWFRTSFEALRREQVANDVIERRADRDLTFFYEETPEGTFLLNMVPDRKPVLTDIELLQVIEDTLGGDLEIDSFTQTKYGLDLRILTKKEFDVNPSVGDIVKYGIYVHNSQTGVYSPEIDGYTKRLTCLNGATTERQHKAWTLSDRDGSVANADLRIWAREAILSVMSSMEEMAAKAKQKVEVVAPATLLSDVITKHHLNKKTVKAIDEAYAKEPPALGHAPSVFTIAQAINRAAHEGKFEYELRSRLESIAGELLFT